MAGDLVWRQGTKRVSRAGTGGVCRAAPHPAAPCRALQRRELQRPPPRLQVYAGPLTGGDRAVVLANFQTLDSQYPRR